MAADRDWERELAAIDRRLASVPDEAPPANAHPPGAAPRPTPPAPAPPAPGQTVAPAARSGRALGTPAGDPGRRTWRAQLALLARVLAGAGVVAALLYWPYASACGAGLGVYLGLVGALGLAGVSTSAAAWRHRAPFVHLLGLAMVAAAAVLGAREVLPRVGYAAPAPGRPAGWACAAPAPAPAAPVR